MKHEYPTDALYQLRRDAWISGMKAGRWRWCTGFWRQYESDGEDSFCPIGMGMVNVFPDFPTWDCGVLNITRRLMLAYGLPDTTEVEERLFDIARRSDKNWRRHGFAIPDGLVWMVEQLFRDFPRGEVSR